MRKSTVAILSLCFMVSANARAAENANVTGTAELTDGRLPTFTFRPISST